MAKIAETIVEDWLNRQGYFTIRGLKKRGRNEIDLLAVRPDDGDAIHIEVTSNHQPTGWIGGNLKKLASREEKLQNIENYVTKKFLGANEQLRNQVVQNMNWRLMIVFNVWNDQKEQTSILKEQFQIECKRLSEILEELADRDKLPFYTDSDAAHFAEIASSHRILK